MFKNLCLCVVFYAVTSQAAIAQPPTPAPVPDALALVKSAQQIVAQDLANAFARREAALNAIADTAQSKANADAEVVRLEGDLKAIAEKRDALKTVIVEKLTAEVDKLQAANKAWTDAQTDLANSAGKSATVLRLVTEKFEATSAALEAAKQAFATFVTETNTAVGVTIATDIDVLVAADAFTPVLGELHQAVFAANTKLEEAKTKAGNITDTAAQDELQKAQSEIVRLALIVSDLMRIDNQPMKVELPASTNEALAALVKNGADQNAAISTLTTTVGAVSGEVTKVATAVDKQTATMDKTSTAVTGLTGEVSKQGVATATALGTLNTTVQTGFAELSKLLDPKNGALNAEIAKLTAAVAATGLSKEKATELTGILNRMETQLGKGCTDATMKEIVALLQALKEKTEKQAVAAPVAETYVQDYNSGRWRPLLRCRK